MGAEVLSFPPHLDGVLVLSGDLTVEQFLAEYAPNSLVELLNGSVYVSPAPSIRHADLVDALAEWLKAGLRPAAWKVRQNINLRLGGDALPIPDITVFRASIAEGAYVEPSDVLLVVEVLSPRSTANHDVSVKRPLYADAGIPCWIVDGEQHGIDVSGDCGLSAAEAVDVLFGET